MNYLTDLAAAWPNGVLTVAGLVFLGDHMWLRNRVKQLEDEREGAREKTRAICAAYNRLRDDVRTLVASIRAGHKPAETLLQRFDAAPPL